MYILKIGSLLRACGDNHFRNLLLGHLLKRHRLQLNFKGYNHFKEAATGKYFTKLVVQQKVVLQYCWAARVLKILEIPAEEFVFLRISRMIFYSVETTTKAVFRRNLF